MKEKTKKEEGQKTIIVTAKGRIKRTTQKGKAKSNIEEHNSKSQSRNLNETYKKPEEKHHIKAEKGERDIKYKEKK
ncbi:hypothetical protein [Lysinibacillus fusiformis]|uniref:hypothetical protein n=1 Tax=Lysinibacillus fusiformis TaxID=28031 RepID=UPI000B7F0B1F|nr:hypothetical protein [Lysinibacillus fusiformis]